ncbi:MAG TPA: sterol desaturase family protein [Chitinophagaceae bacterium]|nr:sterol desaturase family protein [Chitinophagaceae bacterium]
MNELREQWLILISTPIYLIIIGLEILLTHLQHRKSYTVKDTFTNLYLMLLNSGLDLAFRVVSLAVLQYFFLHAFFRWQNAIMYWVMLLLAEDFMYYWLHRFDHEVRFFWAIHVTHHSSHHFNFTVGFRSSVFQPLYRFIYFIPLAWAGFKPLDIAFIYSATQIWGIFVHTELIKKMGRFIEYLFVTPSHHRVHHGQNQQYIDRNMGMFLIIWDKMFGTFEPEGEKVVYGVTKPPKTNNPGDMIFHEFRNMISDVRQAPDLRSKLMYIFGRPGWRHDEDVFAILQEKKVSPVLGPQPVEE